MTISGLFFVVTGIQYWLSTYMTMVLGASADQAAFYFVFLSFTGPILGVVIGGVLTSSLGGYNSTKGQLLQCFAGVLAVVFGLPIPFCYDLHWMAFFMWFLLFFGGFI